MYVSDAFWPACDCGDVVVGVFSQLLHCMWVDGSMAQGCVNGVYLAVPVFLRFYVGPIGGWVLVVVAWAAPNHAWSVLLI